MAGAAAAAVLAGSATAVECLGQAREGAEAVDAETAELFDERCASCHTEYGNDRAAGLGLLRTLSPRAVVAALEGGAMRREGADLTSEQRVRLAEYVTGRRYAREMLSEAAYCSEHGWAKLETGDTRSMGFGGNLAATGFASAETAGLDSTSVSRLALRWAFAFPDASQARTKPTVVGDLLLVGGPFGEVLALDAATGCVRWGFEADTSVRGAVLAGEGPGSRPTVYFVDHWTNAYALDPADGSLLWKRRVGWHAASNATGSPALHDGRLFVPVSTLEVVLAGDPRYECCTASGAVAALDAATGDVLWYHRVVEERVEAGTNRLGTQLWAPSGAPVWSSPTVDPERGLIYVGTGENYTRPTTATSDAVLAIEIESGELAWSFQGTPDDAFTMACTTRRRRENCPSPPGPDLDFGMAPILATRPDGKQLLVAGQKSGVVWALDPDAEGAELWSTRVGKGGALGGIHWGMATDGRYAYAPNSDRGAVVVDVNPERKPSPGLYAIDLTSGEVAWRAPAPKAACRKRPLCHAGNSAAPTAIPGVVFAGGLDGYLRAYAASDGRVLWEFDTTQPVETVNGAPGRGGAIDGPGPVVDNGMVFVNSGYGAFNQMPGNLLLAFAVEDGR